MERCKRVKLSVVKCDASNITKDGERGRRGEGGAKKRERGQGEEVQTVDTEGDGGKEIQGEGKEGERGEQRRREKQRERKGKMMERRKRSELEEGVGDEGKETPVVVCLDEEPQSPPQHKTKPCGQDSVNIILDSSSASGSESDCIVVSTSCSTGEEEIMGISFEAALSAMEPLRAEAGGGVGKRRGRKDGEGREVRGGVGRRHDRGKIAAPMSTLVQVALRDRERGKEVREGKNEEEERPKKMARARLEELRKYEEADKSEMVKRAPPREEKREDSKKQKNAARIRSFYKQPLQSSEGGSSRRESCKQLERDSSSSRGSYKQPKQDSGSSKGSYKQPEQDSGSRRGSCKQPEQDSSSRRGSCKQPEQDSGSRGGSCKHPEQRNSSGRERVVVTKVSSGTLNFPSPFNTNSQTLINLTAQTREPATPTHVRGTSVTGVQGQRSRQAPPTAAVTAKLSYTIFKKKEVTLTGIRILLTITFKTPFLRHY